MTFVAGRLYSPQDVEDEGIAKKQTQAGWRCDGRKGPPYLKVGARVLYRGEDLNAWLNANRVEPVAA